MILVVITIILVVVCLLLGVIGHLCYNDFLEPFGYILGGTFLVVLISMVGVIFISKPMEYKEFKAKYDTVAETITSQSDIRDTNYTKEIIELNTEINLNREFIQNEWIGIFYNEKIAELELLQKGENNNDK